MFTGIIEEIGVIERLEPGARSSRVTISGRVIFSDLKLGDSVAVNGVCLTASSISEAQFTADVMPETLHRTALSGLRPGSRVNLERAMAANGRFGGHMVAGHVDGTGKIQSLRRDDNAVWVRITAGAEILRYTILKGSIAIDGISLTVAEVDGTGFSVSIIPHTGSETTLLSKGSGDLVNLETDLVGKYVEKLLLPRDMEVPHTGITAEFLAEHGF
ncbi:MAG: riboflavin synthase [Oscillospiraceae bacterium]|nr:riboflavin synthase [Oscillospiraceae bacterium]